MPSRPPTFTPDRDLLQQRVRAEHSRLLFESSWASGATAPLVVPILCWVLWPHANHAWLVGWWILKLAVAAARLAIWQAWRRDSSAYRDRWSRWLLVAFAADGLTYGFVATVFMPDDGTYRALMLASVVAIAGVGQIVVAAHARGAAAFVLPLVVPVIVAQALAADRIGLFAAVALAVFLAILGHESRKATANALAMLSLRFEFDDLATGRAQALEAADRHALVKDRFLATMSHEMRTPLHGVLGLARLAQEASIPGSPAERNLATLQRTGAHLLELINDVLDFSRIQSGHVQAERRPFELLHLLDSVNALSSVNAREKGLQFELRHSVSDAEWVLGDATRLRQILLNLTGNAIKFTDSGHVHLTVRRQDSEGLVFEVTDTGPGIDPVHAEAVFEAFHQIDGTDRRRHGGTGLGLSISRELAHAMGGSLDLLPRASTLSGASFRLTLPLPRCAGGQVADEPWAEVAGATAPRSGGQVLVVEDNPVNALIAETMLRAEGVGVVLVNSGEAAVRHVSEHRYSLVLMDCQMPGMDGYEATRRIRQIETALGRRPVPIVAVTAHSLEGDRQRSLTAGMDDHLCKPFSKEELTRLVGRWLHEAPGPQLSARPAPGPETKGPPWQAPPGPSG